MIHPLLRAQLGYHAPWTDAQQRLISELHSVDTYALARGDKAACKKHEAIFNKLRRSCNNQKVRG